MDVRSRGGAWIGATISIAALAMLGACSEKRTDPKDLETRVVEVPDDPDEEEQQALYARAEELLEYNRGFQHAPTRGQREAAAANIAELERWKAELSGGEGC